MKILVEAGLVDARSEDCGSGTGSSRHGSTRSDQSSVSAGRFDPTFDQDHITSLPVWLTRSSKPRLTLTRPQINSSPRSSSGSPRTLTAIAAYNAALTDGDALQGYTNSTRFLNDANVFYAQGNTTASSDQALFVEYADASFAGESDRAAYLRTLMRPELAEAVAWWEATDEAVTPFDDLEGNPYTIADFDQARELEAQAQAEFDEAVDKDEQGDEFELATVFFALSLFFGGIATLIAKRSRDHRASGRLGRRDRRRVGHPDSGVLTRRCQAPVPG